jgi:DNA-binding CsgD family transcriptional regulator
VSVSVHGSGLLVGRAEECAIVDRLLDGARAGSSGALVFRGEPGIGKTAMLTYATESADDMLVVHVVAVESETGLAFGGVQQFVRLLPNARTSLPTAQSEALAKALGTTAGKSPSPFLVGLALVTLLSYAAQERPVLCIVDDAQYLDLPSAQALAFVARRLGTDGIVFLFAVAEPSGEESFSGVAEVRLAGLEPNAVAELLPSAVAGQLDELVRDRIMRVTRGSPLALFELTGKLTPSQLSGDSLLPEPLPPFTHLEQSFLRRVRHLPAETQSMLLLIAAEPGMERDLLLRAAGELDIQPSALDAAESDGLVTLGLQVTFRHPSLGAAIYDGADPAERRNAHDVLAALMDPDLDPDRRAWHRGGSATGPDAAIAADLEHSAERAHARDGYPGAAAFLERAAQLTPDAELRRGRKLAALEAELMAGAASRALGLLDEVDAELTDPLHVAQAQRLRVHVEVELTAGHDTRATLFAAAQALEPLNHRLARDTYLEALMAAVYAGSLGPRGAVLEAAKKAKAAPRISRSKVTSGDLLLDGFASLIVDGPDRAVPGLRRAIEQLRHDDDLAWLGLGSLAATELWDDEALHDLGTARVQLARKSGALTMLPRALQLLAIFEVLVGRFDAAEACLDEAREVRAATGTPGIIDRGNIGRLLLSAWRGAAETPALAGVTARDANARGQGIGVDYAHYALALFEHGRCQYEAALAEARGAVAHDSLYVVTVALPELVEAAARSGNQDEAVAAAERLAGITVASGTEWGLGVLAEARALSADDQDAEDLYLEALDRLGRCRVVTRLSRARLVYGEWLRRKRRRADAREQLLAAHQVFSEIGAQAFAERARAELHATGGRTPPRQTGSAKGLTPHELRIARLAAEGASTSEIAAQMFVSGRTVEYHLRKIFRKLEIRSRIELAGHFPRPK